jgi:glucosamine--fructose-6-phosphate aminotransferase (isomerizing)
MWLEMLEQPAVLDRFVSRWDAVLEAVRSLVADDPPRAAVTLARGSSDNAATLARYLVERAVGCAVASGSPSLWTRYGQDGDYRGVLALGISQSGSTPELVAALGRLRGCGAATIAVTNEPTSPLADVAQLTISLDAGPEVAVPATKTVTAQLLAVVALAAALGHLDLPAASLAALPGAVAAVLADPAPATDLAARWRNARSLLVVARGPLIAAAQETALKVRETAGVLAVGTSTADLVHGPIAAVRPGDPVLLFDADPAIRADVTEVEQRLLAVGADVRRLPAATGIADVLLPIVETVRGQQLAHELAIARDRLPDTPTGLSKITLTA